MTALGSDCASDRTEQREGGRKIDQYLVAVDGLNAGTEMGNGTEMTCGRGGLRWLYHISATTRQRSGDGPGERGHEGSVSSDAVRERPLGTSSSWN